MNRSDIKSAAWLAVSILLLVISLTTGFLDAVIVPIGLSVFGVLVFACSIAAIFHFHKYRRDHPFVPYAGQWSHVMCKKCEARGSTYSVEVATGNAVEGWTREGKYYRSFKRRYNASCNNGHTWRYDPILQRNEWVKESRKPSYRRSVTKIAEQLRAMRQVFHKTYVEAPK